MMFSQDWPYQSSIENGARTFLEQAKLSVVDKEAIAHGNWDRLVSRIQQGPRAETLRLEKP
jgi:predicted TIM-barrel fold metal-dependent hydrolase